MNMSKGVRKRRLRAMAHQKLLGPAPLIVGIDLAKKAHVVGFLDRDRTLVSPSIRILNSRVGVQRLIEHAEKIRKKLGLERVVYFMESTGGYWMNVAAMLEEHHLPYRLVQGIAVHHERKIRDSTRAKDDLRDAEIVGHLGTTGRVVEAQLPTEDIWIEMAGVAAERHELEKRCTADIVRLESLLRMVFPEVFEVFSENKAVTLRVLAKTGLMADDIRRMTIEDFMAQVRSCMGRRSIYPSKLLQLYHLVKGRDELYGVTRLKSAMVHRIRNAATRMDLYEAQKTSVEKQLVKLYEKTSYQKVLDSFVGTSALTQATTLGLMGDPARLPEPSSAVKLAGLDVPAKESGQYHGDTQISGMGRPRLRFQAVKMGRALLRFNEDFRAFAEDLVTRSRRRFKRRQLEVACGAKYLRVFTAMCQTGKTYDSSLVRGKARPTNYRRFELQFMPGGMDWVKTSGIDRRRTKEVEVIAEL
jgi:transposase